MGMEDRGKGDEDREKGMGMGNRDREWGIGEKGIGDRG